MAEHRWTTYDLNGRWCSSRDEALFDALRAGQANLDQGQNDKIILRLPAVVEIRELKPEVWRHF